MLQAPLGASRVLARPGGRRLHLLNASAAALWDCWQDRGPDAGPGAEADALVRYLIDQHDLPLTLAREQVARLLDAWRDEGLLSPEAAPTETCLDGWVRIPPPEQAADGPIHVLTLAGLRLGVDIEDAELERRTLALCEPMATPGETRCGHRLRLIGVPHTWRLTLNGSPVESGSTPDEAALAVFHLAVDLACQGEDRLLVLHGAGLALDDHRGLLLIGPGGSGKTTLAAALHLDGWPLLSDDVVPVRRDGALLGLHTPICLKAGSWPVLEPRCPSLTGIEPLRRFGQAVRYLPPSGPPVTDPLRPGLLLFPRYQPSQPAGFTSLSPEATLQGIVEAEAVIRDLDQDKLNDLAGWVEAVPAYALNYPDLETALSQVESLLRRHAT